MRAAEALRLLLAGRLSQSLHQKLVGLLEHFVYVFALKGNMLAAFYKALKGAVGADGLITHPDAVVTPAADL